MDKLKSLQIFRGIAAIAVLLFHASNLIYVKEKYDFFHSVLGFGYLGVDFFFVLSGFIIYYIHVQDIGRSNKIRPYLLKRFIRLYPIFWVVMIPILFVVIFFPIFDFGGVDKSPPGIISAIFLLPQSTSPLLIVSWTMKHEVLFYILFSLMIILPQGVGRSVFVVWVISIFLILLCQNMAGIFALNTGERNAVLALILNPLNLEFVIGVIAAFSIIKFSKYLTRHGWRIAVVAVLLTILCFYLYINYMNESSNLRAIIIGVPFALVIVSSVSLEMKMGLFSGTITKGFVLLGDSSYSIYLVHYPVLSLIYKVLSQTKLFSLFSSLASMICLIIVSLLIGVLMHLYIERPLLRKLRILLLKRRGLASIPPSNI